MGAFGGFRGARFFFLRRPVSSLHQFREAQNAFLSTRSGKVDGDARLVPKNTPRKPAGACPRETVSLRLNPACSCQQKHVLGVTGMGIALCDRCGVNPSHQQAGLGKGCQHCSPLPSTVLGIPSLLPLGFTDLILSMASPITLQPRSGWRSQAPGRGEPLGKHCGSSLTIREATGPSQVLYAPSNTQIHPRVPCATKLLVLKH